MGKREGIAISILAVIPARGGSKGIPNKNIVLLAGYPLIAYSIIAAKLTPSVTRIIVSTDSGAIAEVAKKYGAEVPFMRPAQYATDSSTDIDYIQHLLNWLKDSEKYLPSLVVLLRPTTPLRDPVIIDQAIKAAKDNQLSTSLRSGHPASESPFKWFLRDNNGYFKSIMPNLTNEAANAPRQGFPEVYIPDGYVDILKPEYIIKSGKLFGEAMAGFISPPCNEIDTTDDLEQVKCLLSYRPNPCFEYLKAIFDREE